MHEPPVVVAGIAPTSPVESAVDASRWMQLSPLLDDLLDLERGARDMLLAQLRSRDPALSEELAALLAQQTEMEREAFLDGQALDAPDATLAGQTIGAYMLERPLGAGGMGSVWLAQRSDGRYEGQVAVKLLNLALVARSGGERFAREGNVLARLAHPHIARLLDAGVTASGQPYLVLEHVQGEPIDRYADAHSLAIDARVRLMLDVLAAVAHAHSKLVLHRDLKPANILVTQDGQVKLLDFGIAKLLEDEALPAAATELTQLAGRAFTPDYAAPEQVEGGDVTTATDVYALGVLLYMLLGGAHPTGKATHTPVQRLRSVVESEPARLSDAAARTDPQAATMRGATPDVLAHRLRGDLDNIVAKALKKAPAERYATVAAFADDLRRYLSHEPVSARADSFAYRSTKFVRRHRLAVVAASATALALVAGVIGTTWQATSARRERDQAVFQAERALAKGNVFNLLLGSLGDGERPLTQREILERAVQLVEKQFGHDPRIAIDLLLPIAGQYMSLGDIERELAVMRRTAVLARASGDAYEVADVACGTVSAEIARGRVDLAREQLHAGLGALAPLAQAPFVVAAECLRAEADVARAEGDTARAVLRISAAIDLAERSGQTRGNVYPALLSNLATVREESGDFAAAHALAKRLQRLDESQGRADSLGYASSRRKEALALLGWGEVRAAQSIVASLDVRWRDAAAAPNWLEYMRGSLLLRQGDAKGAQLELRRSAERNRAQGNVAQALWSELALAQACVELGEFEAAQRLLETVEPGLGRLAHAHRALTPGIVAARLHLARGSLPEAVQAIDSELARLGHLHAGPSLALAAALRVAVRVYAEAGDSARALRVAGDAVAAAERVARDPVRSADVGEALMLLAQAQHLAGNHADARTTAQRAARTLASGFGDEHLLTREALALTSATERRRVASLR